jgi:hypothetical protein
MLHLRRSRRYLCRSGGGVGKGKQGDSRNPDGKG